MNPNGTVPVIREDKGDPLWETGAILRYLAGRYGTLDFWPAKLQARANVDKWAEWAKINVMLNFTAPVFWRVVRSAAGKQDAQAIRQVLDRLHHYLAGRAFTLADIQFGHLLYRYYTIAIDRPVFPAIA